MFEWNDRVCKKVVHEMISVCSRKDADISLAVVNVFARDGNSCYMYRMEEEWKNNIAAGYRKQGDALLVNCFSGSTYLSPSWHSSQSVLERRLFVYELGMRAS